MNLYSIAEQAYTQLFPKPTDETKIRLGHFIATAKALYSTMLWVKSKQEKREEGMWEAPSFLISDETFEVQDNSIDISDIKPLTIIDNDSWIRMMGDFDCPYVRTTVNRMQALRGDDSLGDKKTYFVMGKRVVFPRGTYKNRIRMIYINNGETMPNTYEIDESLAGTLRDKLIETYGGKVGKEDVTNNTNSEV